MIVEKLKAIATTNGWTFDYGPPHWMNLHQLPDESEKSFEERTKYLFLLWKDNDYKINEYGAIEGNTYTGEAMFTVRSKLSDGTYMYKYEEHIKKLEELIKTLYQGFQGCDGWKITRWKTIEVTDEYDTNLDGLKIEFTIVK